MCDYTLGVAGQIPHDTTFLNVDTDARLEYSYWQDPNPPNNRWFQVDLLVVHEIRTLEFEADPGSMDINQTCTLQYTTDVNTWATWVTADSVVTVSINNGHRAVSYSP